MKELEMMEENNDMNGVTSTKPNPARKTHGLNPMRIRKTQGTNNGVSTCSTNTGLNNAKEIEPIVGTWCRACLNRRVIQGLARLDNRVGTCSTYANNIRVNILTSRNCSVLALVDLGHHRPSGKSVIGAVGGGFTS
ncbi:hypothetical protein V6N13_047899 [Hibiscus sabdariffa]